jgi:hypothetical protein
VAISQSPNLIGFLTEVAFRPVVAEPPQDSRSGQQTPPIRRYRSHASASVGRTSYENVAGQGVAARGSVRKPGPEGFPAHVRHAAHVSRLRSGHEAREQKRNKPWPTGPHRTNKSHRFRAQNASARAQQHGSDLWSPVRDEEAAGSNPVTPTVFPQVFPEGAGPCQDRGLRREALLFEWR